MLIFKICYTKEGNVPCVYCECTSGKINEYPNLDYTDYQNLANPIADGSYMYYVVSAGFYTKDQFREEYRIPPIDDEFEVVSEREQELEEEIEKLKQEVAKKQAVNSSLCESANLESMRNEDLRRSVLRLSKAKNELKKAIKLISKQL